MAKILEFKMDKIVKGKLLDSSDSKIKATVGGAVIVEDPNPIFNRVISFDGVDDYVKLPAHASGIKAFSMWINWRYTGGYRYLFDTRPARDLLWFGVGGTGSNWKKMSVDGKKRKLSWGKVPQNKWVHIYFEVKTPFTSSLFLMSKEGKVEFAAGKISRLRMYDRALTDKQLETIRSEDLAVRNTYRAPLPIDFNLLNKEEETKTLYIRDIAKLNSLEMEILNTSPKNIVLKKNIDKEDFHFALEFRPGVLDANHLNLIKKKSQGAIGKGWEISSTVDAESNNLVVIKMRKTKVNSNTDKIIAGKSWSLPLDGLFADNHYGSRSTQVMLKYQNLLYAGDTETSLTGTQIAYLNIVSRTGKEYIPLHVGFIGSNKVVNNGKINRNLILRMTNTSEDYTIKSQDDGSGGDKDSQFTFDFVGRNDTEESKLTDGKNSYTSMNLFAEMKEMDGSIKGAKTALVKTVTDAEANWVYKLDQPLGPGEYIDVEITGIQTTNPSGLANLYIKYEDIPGYWDGKFVVTIEKGPMIFKNDNVAIGTDDPQGSRLFVDGKLTVSGMTDLVGVQTGAANDYLKAQFTLSGGGTVTWANNSLKWNNRFIAISMGKNSSFSTGYVNIYQPSVVTNSNGTIQTVTAEGIRLNSWEALYAIHAIGANESSVTFQIQHYTKSSKAPSNWILVGVVNGDTGNNSIKLGNGVTLNPKTSSTNGSPIPKGMIMMWSGSVDTIPNGWALCDKKNGTPDLRGRFILASGKSTGLAKPNPGDKGGAEKVPITTANLPAHNHGLSSAVSGWLKEVTYVKSVGTGTLTYKDIYDNDENKNDHNRETVDRAVTSVSSSKSSFNFSSTNKTNNTGSGNQLDNMPPFYVLAFIMKL